MPTVKKPVTRPGTCYRDGKLYIFRVGQTVRDSPRIRGGRIEVLRPDPGNPAAWVKDISKHAQFRSFRPVIDLSSIDFDYRDYNFSAQGSDVTRSFVDMVINVFDIDAPERRVQVLKSPGEAYKPIESQENRAWRLAFQPVPEEIRTLAVQFNSHAQWNVLSACLRVPELQELDNPCLLYIHAHIHRTRSPRVSKPMRTLRRLILKPRKDQVGYYGLPASNQTVKILAKIPADSLSQYTLSPLFNILKEQDDAVNKALQHLPVINHGIISLVANPAIFEATTMGFLEQFSTGSIGYCEMPRLLSQIKDCVDIAKQLGWKNLKVRSYDELIHLHNELTHELYKIKIFKMKVPKPPKKGTKGLIKPLTSSREIYQHGKRQGNCIESYLPGISAGQCYLYAYQVPRDKSTEEGTLALVRESGAWRLGEVSTRFNEKPSDEALRLVQRWFIGKRIDKDDLLNQNAHQRLSDKS